MEKNIVGYRFRPTDEELINHYLKNKIMGNTSLVEEAINEIDINSYDPESFPSLSKIKSNDPVWYFFSPTRKRSSRSTKSGYWKPTGHDRGVKDRRGNKIGLKKTLVYYERGARKNVKNHPWVMHEYHIKCWSHPQPDSYVICKIKYKAENANNSYANKAIISIPAEVEEHQVIEENFYGLSMNVPLNPLNEPDDRSLWDFLNPNIFNNNNLNMLPQTPNLARNDEEDWTPCQYEDLLSDQEFIMQESSNKYKPRKPLSGIIIDYYSDSDVESISVTSYQGISSPEDSTNSSNTHFPSC